MEGVLSPDNNGKPNQVFLILLEQAGQGDLNVANEGYAYKNYPKDCQVINEAPKPVPPAGSKHCRPIERVRRVLAVLFGIPYNSVLVRSTIGAL